MGPRRAIHVRASAAGPVRRRCMPGRGAGVAPSNERAAAGAGASLLRLLRVSSPSGEEGSTRSWFNILPSSGGGWWWRRFFPFLLLRLFSLPATSSVAAPPAASATGAAPPPTQSARQESASFCFLRPTPAAHNVRKERHFFLTP